MSPAFACTAKLPTGLQAAAMVGCGGRPCDHRRTCLLAGGFSMSALDGECHVFQAARPPSHDITTAPIAMKDVEGRESECLAVCWRKTLQQPRPPRKTVHPWGPDQHLWGRGAHSPLLPHYAGSQTSA